MAAPPLNGTLIRRTPGAGNAAGLNEAREWWYNPDPAVRDVELCLVEDSADFTSFQLDPAIIIDRWCTAPGVAPFTEIRVTHNGTSASVLFTPVDGVTSCMIVCTLGLTLAPSAVRNGRGDITATATGAQGPVEFSLDDFDTPGVAGTADEQGRPAHAFTGLRPGAHPVQVRETRAGGCRADGTATLSATYGPRYDHPFRDADGTACRLRIYERGYTGPADGVLGQKSPVRLDTPGQPGGHVFDALLLGSECELALYQTFAGEFRNLFSGDGRLHRVDYERDGQLRWRGFLRPEQYDAVFLNPPTPFSLSATDGLGALSDVPFQGLAGQALRGDWTVLQVLQFCLGRLDLGLPLRTLFNLYPDTATTGAAALSQIRVNAGAYVDGKGRPWSCGLVLEKLLETFACRLYQQDGAWWFERLAELTPGPLAYLAYDEDGAQADGVTRTLLATIGYKDDGAPHWQSRAQRQQARPSVARVTLEADPGEPFNILAFALPKPSDVPGPYPQAWSSNTARADAAHSQLLYVSRNKPPVLRLLGEQSAVNGTAGAGFPLQAPWVQTPATPPVGLTWNPRPGAQERGALRVAFTAAPYDHTPAAPGVASTFSLAVKVGDYWLQGGDQPPVLFPVALGIFELTALEKFDISFAYPVQVRGRQPVQLRFYAPVGGATAATVDISELSVTIETANFGALAPYADRYTAATGQLIDREDDALTLYHSDTRNARFHGTLLDGNGLPTWGWYEPARPGQVREAGDYLVAQRALWQQFPAQVLTGLLHGPLPGPGALLTDPREEAPAVYALTSALHDAAANTWQVTGVQVLGLTPPIATLPANAIYYADELTAWSDGAGVILTYDA